MCPVPAPAPAPALHPRARMPFCIDYVRASHAASVGARIGRIGPRVGKLWGDTGVSCVCVCACVCPMPAPAPAHALRPRARMQLCLGNVNAPSAASVGSRIGRIGPRTEKLWCVCSVVVVVGARNSPGPATPRPVCPEPSSCPPALLPPNAGRQASRQEDAPAAAAPGRLQVRHVSVWVCVMCVSRARARARARTPPSRPHAVLYRLC